MTSKKSFKTLLLLFVVVAACACSVTKNIPENQYVLKKNVIKTDHDTKRSERITKAEINKYIKQKPTGNILGIRTWLYDRANPQKDNWWNNTLRNVGKQPVILDTSLTALSTLNIERYIESRGFFQSSETYSFKIDTAKQKAKVTYITHQGEPYRISDIVYDYKDTFIAQIMPFSDSTEMLKVGDVLDNELLNKERNRINDYLKNYGFYDFSIDNIHFSVDTTLGNHMARVKVIVNQTAVTDEQNQTTNENSRIFRIRNINIYPQYDAVAAMNDPDYFNSMDTVTFEGINILYHDKLNVRPEVLRELIYINPNNLYSENDINRTYSNLIGTEYFKSASIIFSEVPQTEERNVTFVGDYWTDTTETKEGELTCEIRCIPALRQSFSIEAEASTTSNFYGLSTTVGYQNRNIFKGAEVLDMRVKFGYEFLKNKGNKNSYEIGAQTSLTFPTFLSPFNVDKRNSMFNPRTTFELSINQNNRPYYNRILSSATFGYSWSNGKNTSYQIKPLDLNMVKLKHIDQEFLDKLGNPYLKNSYTSQLMAGMSGSILYNNQLSSKTGNTLVMRLNWETMGNLLYGAMNLFEKSKNDDPYYKIFGIRFAEYARFDASIVKTIMLGDVTSIAGRLYGGYGFTYGNSKDSAMPFDRLFYAGGINSMRGWQVRTLGPGTSQLPDDMTYPTQLGNVRMEANMEFRFPMWRTLHGALFFDVGNVWYTGDNNLDKESVFHWDTFYEQLGFNTGVGLRFDLKVTVLRLDWGIRLHDPNKPAEERWVKNFDFDNTALNFGIGYPF